MASTKITIPAYLFCIFALLLINTPLASAQIIIIPDCNEEPQDPFCQGQCSLPGPDPPWCDPPEPETNPIIIIPGTLASFNIKTTLQDSDGGTWGFAPFARNVYRGLIERLEAVDFVQNENLFIAHYDWRQPNDQSAVDYLQPIIEQAKQASGADKIDIVAHSMGGLVARSYIQGPNYQDDVDQLITLGTPHLGAADAYIAWEGGDIPNRWRPGPRAYIRLVETALKRVNNADFLIRPESFRTFFPFLHDLLPTSDFATREGQPVALNELTEQNLFLQNLNNTFDDIADNEVNLNTIAGTDLNTLSTINLSTDRSILDNFLNRWRDGHADPDPPPADTTEGDRTVPLNSAHIGTDNLTLSNAEHDKLPEEAQEEVLQALGLDSSGSHLAYELPDSVLGTVILSPVDPKITCADGSVLDQTTNTFPQAEYIDDPTDPDGPKLLVIANPPEGECELELTGTDDGDYTIITTYADEDETITTTNEGTTQAGQVTTTSFVISDDSYIAPPGDLVSLLRQLKQTVHSLKHDHHLHKKSFGKLNSAASRLLARGTKYQREFTKHGSDHKHTNKALNKLQKEFRHFSRELDKQIHHNRLDTTAIQQLTALRNQLSSAGLASQ